jgi:phospholipase/carboxylesterase
VTATATQMELAGLTAHVVGPADATTTCVLLHGFGAPGDDLVSLAHAIDYHDRRAGRPATAPPIRYVFPEAPLELGGLYGDSRAWWLLDLERLEDELRRGVPRDRSDEIPDGLPAAREQLMRLLDHVEARFAAPGARLVLGGFSQGAMLSLDVALHRARPPAGLILMSGTIINAGEWFPRLPALRGLPVLQSHGRADGLLPFSVAVELRDRLRAAGAAVDWHEFVGGHEIPQVVVAAMGAFLAAVAAEPR